MLKYITEIKINTIALLTHVSKSTYFLLLLNICPLLLALMHFFPVSGFYVAGYWVHGHATKLHLGYNFTYVTRLLHTHTHTHSESGEATENAHILPCRSQTPHVGEQAGSFMKTGGYFETECAFKWERWGGN